VPLIVTRRRLGPLPFVTVSLLGADPGITEIRAPVIQPGYETAAVRAVHEALAHIPNWDLMLWSGLNEPMVAALAQEATPQWCGTNEDFVLDLPASWEEFRSQLSRNVRESVRHCYNSLRRAGHEFEFVAAGRPDEVRHALPRFLELHAMRAAMTWGPRHPDRFASPSLRAFLCDVCERLAARDAIRIFQLKINGQIVASRIGFVVADSLYLYYSGFDPAWARYSVMTTTLAEALKFAIANGIRSANLSPTAERSKLRWRPRRVDLRSAVINGAHLRSRVAGMAYRVAQSSNSAPIRVLRGLFWTHNWK
jgi:CelD/BcsL family acetyltransferase involved in cellulose biosynthesis